MYGHVLYNWQLVDVEEVWTNQISNRIAICSETGLAGCKSWSLFFSCSLLSIGSLINDSTDSMPPERYD